MSFSDLAGPTVAAVRSALSTVEDPELGLDIVSLGLGVRDRARAWEREGRAHADVDGLSTRSRDRTRHRGALDGVDGVESVDVELVFEPPWSPEKMSDDARFLLGVYS